MAAVFITQKVLTDWADAGKVELNDTTLLLVQENRTVDLHPAVRFFCVVGGEADPHGLLGKVKTREQLKEMGAEHYMDSVIHGDVAYQVVEGFMGDLSRPKPQPAATQPPKEVPRPVSSLPQPAAEPVAQAPSPAPPEPAFEAPVTQPDQPATKRVESKSGALHEALLEAAEGDSGEGDTEADAAALSRLFLETVQ